MRFYEPQKIVVSVRPAHIKTQIKEAANAVKYRMKTMKKSIRLRMVSHRKNEHGGRQIVYETFHGGSEWEDFE